MPAPRWAGNGAASRPSSYRARRTRPPPSYGCRSGSGAGTIIHEPFENWTRTSADILGTVVIHTDYTVPVEAVRQELSRIVATHGAWDARVCMPQVTDATERTVQLRALVSARDVGKGWDLRVHVREKLIEYLQREHHRTSR